VGNYNLRSMALFVTGPLVDDTLYGRYSLSSKERDGYAENVFDSKDKGDEENINMRVGLLAPIRENTENFILRGHE
jgi:iron complex outermembrane receptor protein